MAHPLAFFSMVWAPMEQLAIMHLGGLPVRWLDCVPRGLAGVLLLTCVACPVGGCRRCSLLLVGAPTVVDAACALVSLLELILEAVDGGLECNDLGILG